MITSQDPKIQFLSQSLRVSPERETINKKQKLDDQNNTDQKVKKNYKIIEQEEYSQQLNKSISQQIGQVDNDMWDDDLDQDESIYLQPINLYQKQNSWQQQKSQMFNQQHLSSITEQIENIHKNENIFDRVQLLREGQFSEIQLEEYRIASEYIIEAVQMREKYMHIPQFVNTNQGKIDSFIDQNAFQPPKINWKNKIQMHDDQKYLKLVQQNGVYIVINEEKKEENYSIIDKEQFIQDFVLLENIVHDKKTVSLSIERLKLLRQKFKMHLVMNHTKEITQQKTVGTRDFDQIPKVDTHIHHTASMNSKDLCDFIKEKYRLDKDKHVYKDTETQEIFTLKQIFNKLNINPETINIDNLSVKADNTIFQRFDNFNLKFSPLQSKQMRWIFFGGRENYIKGRYLGELTRRQMNELEKEQIYQELRFSICGRSMDEWEQFALWIDENNLYCQNVKWMIQVPRVYSGLLQQKNVSSFQEFLDRIFKPMFEVTLNPSSNPLLFQILCQIGGFDSVDDESNIEKDYLRDFMFDPIQFKESHNPHYSYYSYYFYANIQSLNIVRAKLGLNTFSYRPHCGEIGSINHLTSSFLLANGINHGIQLKENPVLQYLYYITQIGIAMSPLSNNKLFLKYKDSPFPKFFQIGHNISLSTDDPLILHLTKQPLLEEYSIASQIWDLNSVDLCEIARNSVIQSDFPYLFKEYWAGQYKELNTDSNNPQHSNVPPIRHLYRLENITQEYNFLFKFGEQVIEQQKNNNEDIYQNN